MMNFSIKAGDVATEWKKARVTPLYKSGDAFLVNNYRPVSVLPVISKIIERHVFNSFYDYLNSNHLLTEHQSGFRPKHSCETALHNIIDNWLCNIDAGKLTGVLFIDLSKAFDTVNHDVLLKKLLSFGICQNTFNWFSSYLRNRTQCVKWKGVLSKEKNVTIGVPQGSILGPLFFILFVNDYPKCLKHSTVTIYADDTTQDVSDKSIDVIEKKLHEDLLNSMNWMSRNKLTMNLKKTQCMLIGTSQNLSKCRKLCVKVGDVLIENVKCAKLLGVNIDECLSWSVHIDVLCKKLQQKDRCFTAFE